MSQSEALSRVSTVALSFTSWSGADDKCPISVSARMIGLTKPLARIIHDGSSRNRMEHKKCFGFRVPGFEFSEYLS